MTAARASRKLTGAWYTPPELIEVVVEGLLADFAPEPGRTITVIDPACGDGRFLTAVGDRLTAMGIVVDLTGCDVDATALDSISDPRIQRIHADALRHRWGDATFDIVVGNPPFLSQMAISTTHGGSSRHGGGPYADAAVEFMSLGVRLARPDGGRIGLVLPQSILGARDAEPVREQIAEQADLHWSWWQPRQRHFDANVNVCAIGLQRPGTGRTTSASWTGIVTDRLGIPVLAIDSLRTAGTLGDRAHLNANFRDEYYALVPAVSDEADGPPLVTSGLIDPGTCHWGHRPVRFAKRDFQHPRVDLSVLTGRFPAWARRKLVPKVLVANQTRIIEAVADPDGAWLPGVPVSTATPTDPDRVWDVAAVLTAPVAAIAAWQHGAGTGLSTTAMRLRPASLAATPWPAGDLTEATDALRNGSIETCALLVSSAYGLTEDQSATLVSWWSERMPVAAV